MTPERREQAVSELLEECRALRISKGVDYSGASDVLDNFKRNAEPWGLTKYQVLSIYLSKHLDSVRNSIKANPSYPQVESEPIRNRIADAVNYLLLLHCLLEEDAGDSQVDQRKDYPHTVLSVIKP